MNLDILNLEPCFQVSWAMYFLEPYAKTSAVLALLLYK